MADDPTSSSQIFVANINIMSTGVNLQACCRTGVAINFHHNAKTARQMHHRLYRISQTRLVTWHILQMKNSFHDHHERICLEKWARQLSAEMSLAEWYPNNIRELVIFENSSVSVSTIPLIDMHGLFSVILTLALFLITLSIHKSSGKYLLVLLSFVCLQTRMIKHSGLRRLITSLKLWEN